MVKDSNTHKGEILLPKKCTKLELQRANANVRPIAKKYVYVSWLTIMASCLLRSFSKCMSGPTFKPCNVPSISTPFRIIDTRFRLQMTISSFLYLKFLLSLYK
jgi:hypothetical protein